MRPDTCAKQRHTVAVGAQVLYALRIVVRIRLDCNHMGFGKRAEEVSRGVANIRSTINDQLWLADVEQAAICLLHEDLLEDIEITRSVAGIDRTARAAASQRCWKTLGLYSNSLVVRFRYFSNRQTTHVQ